MNLWCESCCCLHHFTDNELERIVYALQGECQTVTHYAKIGPVAKGVIEALDEKPGCLKDTLDGSHDIEVFLEHVQGTIECRRRLGKLRGAVLRAHLVEGAGRR